MRDFCYYEPWEVKGQDVLYKVLIVTNDNDVMVGKYNLTLIGDESINSYEELKQKFGENIKTED